MDSCNKIWSELLNEISIKVSTISFEMWFAKLQPLTIDCGKIILVTQHKNDLEIFNAIDMKKTINDCIKNLNDNNLNDYLIITPDEVDNYQKNILKIEPVKQDLNSTIFDNTYTFENFIVGESNKIAYAAANTVANNPGNAYNPLFIYGGVGLGKTHILHAIGNYILNEKPNTYIIYTTTEQFTNDYISSINNKKNINSSFEFREKYRKVDILMLDDIQFLANKTSTQEALFHTFNDLKQLKKQIIIASDRHPKELTFIEERLKTRFQQGLTVLIGSPDIETRIAIIQKKAYKRNFRISNDIINYIAENIETNIREIEGAISKLIFYCQINGKNSADDLMLAKEALKDDIEVENGNVLNMDTIVDATCSYFNISKADIKSNKKPKNIVMPRQIAIYLIDDLMGATSNNIGDYFGGKDHSTILFSKNKIIKELKDNNLLKKQINDIKNMINKK